MPALIVHEASRREDQPTLELTQCSLIVSLFEYMGVNAMEDTLQIPVRDLFTAVRVQCSVSQVSESTNILAVQLRCVLE